MVRGSLPRTVAWLALYLFSGIGLSHAVPDASAPDRSSARLKRIPSNAEAVIPPQCYTKTEDRFNPCYTCHQNYVPNEQRSNYMDDGALQGDYNFSSIGVKNHWTNLFVDRRAAVAAMADSEIKAYVEEDNYRRLTTRLKKESYDGWIPDLRDLATPQRAFDAQGFAHDGSGWVAFNYKPLPSTFWPTNGSTDDVMIRLPAHFRQDASGRASRDVYLANLAIVEAAIKNLTHVDIPAVDENVIGSDLDGDGRLRMASALKRPAHYVGAAATEPVVSFLYPRGTEFLHTVRYIGVAADGRIYNPPRMKEVRYARKERFIAKSHLGVLYDEERWEKEQGLLPKMGWQGNKGIVNGFGWRLAAFIEDKNGELRAQNYEEMLFCKGCHTSVGATIDQTFSFPRKQTGAAGWRYIDLHDMPDVPTQGERLGEYRQYLERVGGGDEFRANDEMRTRFFDAAMRLDVAKLAGLDVYSLITPTPARALALNKAYRLIVAEQSFIRGRDATLRPTKNVYAEVDTEIPPLPPEHRVQGSIFLNWPLLPTFNSPAAGLSPVRH